MKDLVIGVDSSTTATKAIAWRRDGSIAGQGRSPIPLLNLGGDRYEQNPDDWWRSACAALQELFREVSGKDIAAIAIANQRETFVPLAGDGTTVRPAIIWLDRRCGEEVAWMADRVGRERIHQISGKPPDIGPVAYRIAWMLRNEKDLFKRTAMFADVQGYLVGRLTGKFSTSWASADPLGMFDMEKKDWSEEILHALALSPERLPHPARPATVVGEITTSAAAATGLERGTLVIAGGGDGQAAGLGVNALNDSCAYLNLGTAVVSGIYSTEYRIGNAWRTMGSCSGKGYYFETSLRAGAFLIDWFLEQVCQAGVDRSRVLRELEAAAASLPSGSDGVLTLPYWGAVMTPYWDAHARGCFIGLTASHTRAHLYRSVLEGIALEQTLVTGMIEAASRKQVSSFIAIGGGAASDLWCQIIADASGKTVRRSRTVEASSLGAAICAAAGAGWFDNVEEAAEKMCDHDLKDTPPRAESRGRYAELLKVYGELYPKLRATFSELARFSA